MPPASGGWAAARTPTGAGRCSLGAGRIPGGRLSGGPPGPAPSVVPLRPRPFIFQNLRRNICPHFYLTGPRGAIPVHAPHLLKGLIRQPQTTNRCQLRAGVHMEEAYVLDVCLSARFNQCVFYEDELSRVDEGDR
ncbi:MAG TPA: hypothetical protein VJ141_02190 [Candidatus Limnocylindrales bacterium]|nr:hypothetical protein [Candidatus Limnocylindrales bacterium]